MLFLPVFLSVFSSDLGCHPDKVLKDSAGIHKKAPLPFVLSSHRRSIFPTLFHRLPYALGVFLPVVFVEVTRLHIRGTRGVGVVEQTAGSEKDTGQLQPLSNSTSMYFCLFISYPMRRSHPPSERIQPSNSCLSSYTTLSSKAIPNKMEKKKKTGKRDRNIPLHTRQDSRNIIRRTPPILQNIQT